MKPELYKTPSNVNYPLLFVLAELDELTDSHEACDGSCDAEIPHIQCDVCLACTAINEASLILRRALQQIRDGRVSSRCKPEYP